MSKSQTIDELRDQLAKQILELAIASDNPQYKVDAFKATERYGKTAAAKAVETSSPGGMAVFAARVKRAEQRVNGEDAGEPDEPPTPDR